jgi:hypothetical protein
MLQLQIDGQALKTVDWAETIQGAKDAGVEDAEAKVDEFMKGWYASDISAKEHHAVVTSYQQVQDGAVACGRR